MGSESLERTAGTDVPTVQVLNQGFAMKKSAPPSADATYSTRCRGCPPQLSDAAADLWGKIIAEWELDGAGRLILASGLEAYDRMRAAQKLIEEHGLVAPDRFGQLKANPAVLIERDSRAAMLQALKALHLDLEPLNDGPGRPPAKPGSNRIAS